MDLRGRRIKMLLELWCLVASGGLHLCVSSTSFEKNDIGWPQQPLTAKVSDISKKLDFCWFIACKGTGIGHLDVKDDKTIRISNFFDEMRLLRSLRQLRLMRPLRSLRLQRFYGLENHYWGLQSHPGIWIQLYFYVLKNKNLG